MTNLRVVRSPATIQERMTASQSLTNNLSRAQIRSIARADRKKISLWTGSVSSGKTISSLIAFLHAVSVAPRQGIIIMTGRTLQTIERNIINPLQSLELFGPLAKQIHHTTGATTATIFGRTVHIVGAADVRSEGRIRGATVSLAYVDEVTLIPQSFWMMLLSRLRVPGARLLATTNPDSPRHWLRRDFILRASDVNMQVFEFRLRDNPSLTDEYIRDLEAQYVGLWRDRFILGLWRIAEGAIYDMFDPDRHVISGPLPKMLAIPGVGVDYGTRHPFSAHLIGITQDRRICVAAEYRHDPAIAQASLTDADYSRELRAWLRSFEFTEGRLFPQPMLPQWIAIDPAALSFKLQMYHDGVGNVVNAKNDVVDGIRVVSSLMASNQLVIHESCQGLLDEIPSYSWDDRAAERGEDKPVKVGDDGVDSMRYGIRTTEQVWRPYLKAA
jgi:PBSX family phage terminase large subunit